MVRLNIKNLKMAGIPEFFIVTSEFFFDDVIALRMGDYLFF